jgi:hypothetical protein
MTKQTNSKPTTQSMPISPHKKLIKSKPKKSGSDSSDKHSGMQIDEEYEKSGSHNRMQVDNDGSKNFAEELHAADDEKSGSDSDDEDDAADAANTEKSGSNNSDEGGNNESKNFAEELHAADDEKSGSNDPDEDDGADASNAEKSGSDTDDNDSQQKSVSISGRADANGSKNFAEELQADAEKSGFDNDRAEQMQVDTTNPKKSGSDDSDGATFMFGSDWDWANADEGEPMPKKQSGGRPRGDFRCDKCSHVARDGFNLRSHKKRHEKDKFRPQTVCYGCGLDLIFPVRFMEHLGACMRRRGKSWADQKREWAEKRAAKEAERLALQEAEEKASAIRRAKREAEKKAQKKAAQIKRMQRKDRRHGPVQFICIQCGMWVRGEQHERMAHDLQCILAKLAKEG